MAANSINSILKSILIDELSEDLSAEQNMLTFTALSDGISTAAVGSLCAVDGTEMHTLVKKGRIFYLKGLSICPTSG
jgi:hypothetical protein